MPGVRLAGSVAPAPAAWTQALDGESALCDIESRPADPHSIQLDCFVDQPDSRVRIADGIYELRAVEVTDPARRGPILRARGYDPVPDGVVLFRFEPRT